MMYSYSALAMVAGLHCLLGEALAEDEVEDVVITEDEALEVDEVVLEVCELGLNEKLEIDEELNMDVVKVDCAEDATLLVESDLLLRKLVFASTKLDLVPEDILVTSLELFESSNVLADDVEGPPQELADVIEPTDDCEAPSDFLDDVDEVDCSEL
jgi:hypothetical protein